MKKCLLPVLLVLLSFAQARADEGMWLLQQLAAKYADMQKRGLKLQEYDIYNPNGTSLKDAVVMFDGGCTGEVISPEGLVLTNHHCGYDYIQKHSSLEHNYLEDGFWAKNYKEELPCPGLEVMFVENIEDVTPFVKNQLKKIKDPDGFLALSPKFLTSLAPKIPGKAALLKEPGIRFELKAFYGGNKYLLFTERVYTDVRFVAAPPSSIGKFGADTDNWVWPRHAGDFSIFRIYADKNGMPAEYSENNQPLKPKRYLKVSLDGVKEGDFAMIMGFPGRTNHFYTPAEVMEWKTIDNDIRIRMRDIRQKAMLEQMLADPQIKIMYAAKYASSQNAFKRAQGANWAIENHGLLQAKEADRDALLAWSKRQNLKKNIYEEAVQNIRKIVGERKDLRRQLWYLEEGPVRSIEFVNCPSEFQSEEELEQEFAKFFNKDYSPMVDKKVSVAILSEYIKQIPLKDQPEAIQRITKEFNGNVQKFVDVIFEQSAFTSKEKFGQFIKQLRSFQTHVPKQVSKTPHPAWNLFYNDPMVSFARSVWSKYAYLKGALKAFDGGIAKAHKTYVAGFLAMSPEKPIWPDANLTLRFTYGNVKGYSPRDDVYYGCSTTLKGVMEKEDPNNWEYVVAPRLKEIYQQKDFGPYGKNEVMNVDFCATTHTTGGNSGSPVFNANGELIGLNFDRNWEGVGGDIQYLPAYQRSIIVDIRYVMLIIDKLGGSKRLINEIFSTAK